MHRAPPKISCRAPGLAALALAAGAGCGFSSSAGTRPPGTDAGIGPSPDAPPIDTPPGCLGPSGWQVCIDVFPSLAIVLPDTLDVDKSSLCLHDLPASWTAAQPDACIVAGETVDIGSTKVTGSRPLVIVGHRRITVAALLDVGSHRTGPPGPGSQSTECTPSDQLPANGGGGAGGSFATTGGDGGKGDSGNRQNGHAGAGSIGAPARLHGGCGGQPGGGSSAKDAGAGGGAVYLLSGGSIVIDGVIDASGAGGAGGGAQNGGSGGGSGGMIILHGAPVMTNASSRLLANGGGGGGGGAASSSKGGDGQDPGILVPIVPALGGPGGGLLAPGSGGTGGDGAANLVTAAPGIDGDTGGGGGGGGGGAGYIQSSQAPGLAVVSPAATIRP